MTKSEALSLALDWAEGRRSHLNEMITAESRFDHRPSTLASCAAADAAEVVKWTALAAVLPTDAQEVKSSADDPESQGASSS